MIDHHPCAKNIIIHCYEVRKFWTNCHLNPFTTQGQLMLLRNDNNKYNKQHTLTIE